MDGNKLKKLVPLWAEKIGYEEARQRLAIARVAPSTAAMLLKKNGYISTPKGALCDKLRLAMKDFIAKLEAS